jgi:hypothetical protein
MIWDILGVVLVLFTLFCNIFVLVVDVIKEKTPWSEVVRQSQDTKFGRVCMMVYYFIPTILEGLGILKSSKKGA